MSFAVVAAYSPPRHFLIQQAIGQQQQARRNVMTIKKSSALSSCKCTNTWRFGCPTAQCRSGYKAGDGQSKPHPCPLVHSDKLTVRDPRKAKNRWVSYVLSIQPKPGMISVAFAKYRLLSYECATEKAAVYLRFTCIHGQSWDSIAKNSFKKTHVAFENKEHRFAGGNKYAEGESNSDALPYLTQDNKIQAVSKAESDPSKIAEQNVFRFTQSLWLKEKCFRYCNLAHRLWKQYRPCFRLN